MVNLIITLLYVDYNILKVQTVSLSILLKTNYIFVLLLIFLKKFLR